jgi:hypothetical protein
MQWTYTAELRQDGAAIPCLLTTPAVVREAPNLKDDILHASNHMTVQTHNYALICSYYVPLMPCMTCANKQRRQLTRNDFS